MSSSGLEQTRALHEDLERIESQLVEVLLDEPRGARDAVLRSHVISHMLGVHQDKRKELTSIYDDTSRSRAEELEQLGQQGQAMFSAFYEKLRDIKEYHKKHPDLEVDPYISFLPNIDEGVIFTTEENYGKYLDLHALHLLYNNLPFRKGQPESYRVYLKTIRDFSKYNSCTGPEYIEYLTALKKYLLEFLRRAQPLLDIPQLEAEIEEKYKDADDKMEDEDEVDMGRDYCRECRKLFATEAAFNGHLRGKKHEANVLRNSKKFAPVIRKLIHTCSLLLDQLKDSLKDTLIYIESKQSKTYEEIQAELEEREQVVEEEEEEESSDEEETVRRGIPNYPVGWDGKPIPYWLYQLHGLGIEYKCEICGNASYWGPRAFERHFTEARHSYGMRCLGIPNTPHFNCVTKINDALLLWEKIKKDKEKSEWNANEAEEFEDAEGNVVTGKKTYELMARQGLMGKRR